MKYGKAGRGSILAALLILAAALLGPVKADSPPAVGPLPFHEIWAYLMAGEESKLTGNEPFTDVCYFSARIDPKGNLAGRRLPFSLSKKGNIRWHLVVAELGNKSLTHFCLNGKLPYRKKLINDIASASAGYSGVQIDFEAVLSEDRDGFLSFLADLKKAMGPGKTLSVALPARRKDVADAYDYYRIAAVVDRVIIMAYDQHWSSSSPGPVASLSWCGEIQSYAKSRIPREKLVMGLPLYGRAWQNAHFSRAVVYEQVKKLMGKKSAVIGGSKESGPSIKFDETVTVSVYFDTVESILERVRLYAARNAGAIAFWRIGQGDPGLWKHLSVKHDAPDKTLADKK